MGSPSVIEKQQFLVIKSIEFLTLVLFCNGSEPILC